MSKKLKCSTIVKEGNSYSATIFDKTTNKVVAKLLNEDKHEIGYMGRLFSSLDDILEEVYAYRMFNYAKEYNNIIKKGKHPILADKLAGEKVSNFDKIINYIVTGKKEEL